MNGKLGATLVPMLDSARNFFEMIPEIRALDQNEPRATSWRTQYANTVFAIYDTVEHYYVAQMQKCGIELPHAVNQEKELGHSFSLDPLDLIRHDLIITITGMTVKDSGEPLSNEDCLHMSRRLARRINALLMKESIQLFVFVEMESHKK